MQKSKKRSQVKLLGILSVVFLVAALVLVSRNEQKPASASETLQSEAVQKTLNDATSNEQGVAEKQETLGTSLVESKPQAAPAQRSPSTGKTGPQDFPSAGTDQKPETTPEAIAKIDAAVSTLQELSATYDAKSLPKMEPFLYSDEPAIREAALNAIVNLGDEAGAEILRRAARSMVDPKEELEALEKAAFLRLPPGKFEFRKKASPAAK
jgi:hypothetical protein